MLKPESAHGDQLIRTRLVVCIHSFQKPRLVLPLHNKRVHRKSFNVSEDRTTYQDEGCFFRLAFELRQSPHRVVGIKCTVVDDLPVLGNRRN